jgi:predicted enzyme related to lactoylglutathione lyase
MTFELFQAHPGRLLVKAWGNGQAFRPAILVSDLSATATLLQKQGIQLSQSAGEFGSQLEMTGPEGLRWGLMESPNIEMDWAHPIIGGIELKAANLKAQKEFYTQVLGMTLAEETDQAVHLNQSNGEAWLRIEAGGVATSPRHGEDKPAFFYPIWISYETNDAKQANVWLQGQNVTFLRPLTYHADWEGTDIIIADMDGNAIQVVQYGRQESH